MSFGGLRSDGCISDLFAKAFGAKGVRGTYPAEGVRAWHRHSHHHCHREEQVVSLTVGAASITSKCINPTPSLILPYDAVCLLSTHMLFHILPSCPHALSISFAVSIPLAPLSFLPLSYPNISHGTYDPGPPLTHFPTFPSPSLLPVGSAFSYSFPCLALYPAHFQDQ